MIDGAFELTDEDFKFTFCRLTEIPVSPLSILCLRLRELDFFKDFDRPELPLQSHSYLCSFDILIPPFVEFQVGSLLLLLLHFFEDPLH